ncbi:sulfotransferase family protein [Jidongwangia harbinensis]|uniref:sulfotransferase family protein n=1 Tax=Jidongwangia harbinensis TaxID=2878561 RepID=UPI001CD92DA3|nr:sulfotransferase family protein [Jidongwangia harbinensis]MCA2217527.1 sulfotransferase family protein [Jidongwangia harbinensis]
MDVIGVGFGRTGTLSLKAALERLGLGPCMHMIPVLGDPDRARLFHKAAEGDDASLDAAMAGHRSTVDWPGTYFWRDLVARHPDAKVVLTVREPESWYDSAYRTIYRAATAPRPADDGMAAAIGMAHAVVWDGTFGGRFADREFALRVFTEHNDAVRREVPPDRLLEFQVAQGWEPLCAFLDVPVPPEPFPRLNDSAAFAEMVASRPA